MRTQNPPNLSFYVKVGKALLLVGGFVFLLGIALSLYSVRMESEITYPRRSLVEISLLLWIPTIPLGVAIAETGFFLYLYKK